MKFYKYIFWILVLFSLVIIPRNKLLLPDHPIAEEAFYNYQMAYSFCRGDGFNLITVEKNNVPQHSFSPLFSALIAPVYLIENDKYEALRYILVILLILYTTSALIFAKIISHYFSKTENEDFFWLTAVLFMSCISAFDIYFSGLEISLLLLIILIIIRFLQVCTLELYSNKIILGCLFGLVISIQFSAVLLILSFVLTYLMLNKDEKLISKITNVTVIAIVTFLVSLPSLYLYFVSEGLPQQIYKIPSNLTPVQKLFKPWGDIANLLVPHSFFWDKLLTNTKGVFIRFLIFGSINYLTWKQNIFKEIIDRDKNAKLIFISMSMYSVMLIIYNLSTGTFYKFNLSVLILIGMFFAASIVIKNYGKIKGLFNLIFPIYSIIIPVSIILLHFHIWVDVDSDYMQQLKLADAKIPKNEAVVSSESGLLSYFRDKSYNIKQTKSNNLLIYNVLERQKNCDAYLKNNFMIKDSLGEWYLLKYSRNISK